MKTCEHGIIDDHARFTIAHKISKYDEIDSTKITFVTVSDKTRRV